MYFEKYIKTYKIFKYYTIVHHFYKEIAHNTKYYKNMLNLEAIYMFVICKLVKMSN